MIPVKKTEKIEIRVSPEEKEALSSASRSEGRTASDVLREHVRRYVDAAAMRGEGAKKEKKMSWISKAAYVALGAAVSVPAVMFAAADDNPSAPGFEIHMTLEEQSGDQHPIHYRAQTRIPLGRSEPTMLTMPSGESDGYRVAIVKKNNADKTFHFIFNICRETADGCDKVLSPGIVTAFGGHSSLRVGGAGAVEVDINISSREG